MIGIKPENAFELDTVELDKSETYPEKKVLPEDGLCRYLYEPSEQIWRSKKMNYCFSTIKIQIGYTEASQSQIIAFCITWKRHDRAFLGEKLIHITERSGGHWGMKKQPDTTAVAKVFGINTNWWLYLLWVRPLTDPRIQ